MTDTVTATSPLDRLPPELLHALYTYPDDFALRCAVADELLALGEVGAGECMRWSAEKERVFFDIGCAGWTSGNPGCRRVLPYELVNKEIRIPHDWWDCDKSQDCHYWHRVVYRWLNSTPSRSPRTGSGHRD